MKTVIFDTDKMEVLSIHDGGYRVDGKGVNLSEPLIELTIVDMQPPLFDSKTHKIEANWIADTLKKTYTHQWELIPLTEHEIVLQNWQYPQYAKRIIAPSMLFDVYPTIATWMQINQLPIVMSDDGATCYLYMNRILPQHQAIVDELSENISIEERPI